jgi:hypothetical protein
MIFGGTRLNKNLPNKSHSSESAQLGAVSLQPLAISFEAISKIEKKFEATDL